MTWPIETTNEFQNAVEWLTAAVTVGERALAVETSPEAREEWIAALSRKRELLKKLEQICNPCESNEDPH